MDEIKYVSTVGFEFETLIDEDLGILKYLQINYPKNKYLDPIVSMASDYTLKCLSVSRDNQNPVSVIIANEYKDSADTIYNDIITTKYDDILKLAGPLCLLGFIQTLRKTGELLKCSVICKNAVQEQYIKNLDPTINTISDGYSTELSGFNAIYIKNYRSILNYKKLEGKSIYILDYAYNLEPNRQDKLPNIGISMLLSDANILYLVSPYINLKLPK